MNIIQKIKRLYYKFRNDDPVHKCPVYLKEGCSHVDGILCNYPNCSMVHNALGDKWISCVECEHQDLCCSKNFGLGCYEGKLEGV